MGTPKSFDVPDYKFDWGNTAFDKSDILVRELAVEIVKRAALDCLIAVDGEEKTGYEGDRVVFKNELERFFEGWFFGMIIDAVYHDMAQYEQKNIIKEISKKNFTARSLSETFETNKKIRRRH